MAQVMKHPKAANTQKKAERGNKSPSAFRTISEVSELLDVPQHVLRFWETKFSQIKPLKRGGGRRYYRPNDIELLQSVRTLLYRDGYTIKGVQKLLRETKGALMEQAEAKKADQTAQLDEKVTKPILNSRQRAELSDVLDELKSVRTELKD